MSDELLYFNGINGASGDYLSPPMTPKEVAALARGETLDKQELAALRQRYEQVSQPHAGTVFGVDPNNLAEAGWGVMFASDDQDTEAIKEALSPLLKLRREQAGKQKEKFYREFVGEDGYLPDEKKTDWLARHEADVTGPADPNQVPYYLLLVGDPEQIPYRFQYQLDVQYAVGRIQFDTLDEYEQYARSVVAAEMGKVALPRRAAFWGVRNPDDRATNLSAPELVAPLAEKLQGFKPWQLQTHLADEANKARLASLLGGDQTPALLFTASHGMGFPNGHEKQLSHQGALLCQDWPGPLQWKGAIPPEFYFAADDVSDEARLLGMMAFHFACYGAGTPQVDDYVHHAAREAATIAPYSFLARLPQRLLGHPKGGALAVVGHVDRAWGYSFMWERAKHQLGVFESALKQLMAGGTIGYSLEYFNNRYAELSSELTSELDAIKKRRTPDEVKLTGLWTANNDARAYIIVGDPAVRLPLADVSAAQRPALETINVSTPKAAESAPPAAGLAPTSTTPMGAAATAATSDVDYGLMDAVSLKQLYARLTTTLQQVSDKLSGILNAAVDNTTSLEVATYTSEEMQGVGYEKGQFTGETQLFALTRIGLNGNVQSVVPKRSDAQDEALWQKHLALVEQAQAQRGSYLKAVMEAAASAALLLKP